MPRDPAELLAPTQRDPAPPDSGRCKDGRVWMLLAPAELAVLDEIAQQWRCPRATLASAVVTDWLRRAQRRQRRARPAEALLVALAELGELRPRKLREIADELIQAGAGRGRE